MFVTVESLSVPLEGGKLVLDVQETDTVLAVKENILETSRINLVVAQLSLFQRGDAHELENDRTIYSCELGSTPRLSLARKIWQGREVKITILGDRTEGIIADISSCHTILELKQIISQQLDPPCTMDAFRLIISGRVLNDECLVADLRLHDCSLFLAWNRKSFVKSAQSAIN
jgi:hypothetical protein